MTPTNIHIPTIHHPAQRTLYPMMPPFTPISIIKDPFDLNRDMHGDQPRRRPEPELPTFRQLIGRAFTRIGGWLEGRQPQPRPDTPVAA